MTADRIVRPVDAAGLILLRGRRDAPEILLGRRHSKAAFLPDIYVVPGGRVDPGDHLPSGFRERPHPSVAKALHTGRRPPIAFLRAGLRELHEETGLILAGSGSGKPAEAEVWQAYGEAGSAPDFGALDFVLRANAFLHHMVRNIVGTLVHVGKGARAPGWALEVLRSRNRSAAAATFGPEGLYLESVEYGASWELPRAAPALIAVALEA